MRPFQSFDSSQPVFIPVILNFQGFYLPVRENSVISGDESKLHRLKKNAQMGLEASKKEEGVGLSTSDFSAFKTTKECLTTSGSPLSQNQNSQPEKISSPKKEKAPRRPPKERSSITAFSVTDQASSEMNGEDDQEKSGRMNWSKQEERKLIQLVQLFGKHWKHISEHLPNRNPKQIRQRYLNYLRSDISNDKWTPEEDTRLLQLVDTYGHRWKFMEKKMKKRSQNQLKNRYYGHLKKQQMKETKPQSDLAHLPLPLQEQNMEIENSRKCSQCFSQKL